jgi:hypothetical protein
MSGTATVSRVGRVALAVVTVLMTGFLALRALSPSFGADVWFGRTGSWQTVAIVAAVVAVLAVWTFRARNAGRAGGVPVAIIGGLGVMSLVLGFSSYWPCYDAQHPKLFTALTFTGALVKGTISDQSIGDPSQPAHLCPIPTPVALDVARLAAQAAIFLGLASVAVALFRSQTDRIHVRLARSVTAVVGIDEETPSMIGAIAKSLGRRDTLVVITAIPERACVYEARNHGARIATVDFARPATLAALSLWRKVDRLYLLSADPSENLQRLGVITERLSVVGRKNRLPLIVRIDDPWQAEVWRAQQFGGSGGSDRRWVADAVGKYEVTARRLLDTVINTTTVDRIMVCGASPLALAVCADMAQRRRERDYYTAPDQAPLPSLTLVAQGAEEYLHDHEFHQQQLGFASPAGVDAVTEAPGMSTLLRLIGAHGGAAAVILADSDSSIDTTTGTRLAARFPEMPVYAWDPAARASEDRVPIVGRLRTYRLALDVAEGQAHDAWERAAMLIHTNWVKDTEHNTPATRLWPQLDEFYRESNRRLVRNILWMAEEKGEHTWSSGGTAAEVSVAELRGLAPTEQMRRLGFDRDAALAMARAEHEDWCRYYRAAGWRPGERSDERKTHNKLVGWAVTEADPVLLDAAVGSVAAALLELRELGYRSRAAWESFRRSGMVTAEKREAAWTWAARSGQTMHADAGDWAVQDAGGDSWSVRDDIFRASYQHVGENRWRRTGVVSARPARIGEIVHTAEGPLPAAPGDWVVKGTHGELWPVSADRFAQRYERVDG